ncbi:hypothetical protein NL108_011560 [Boleophthalmus pectinirostris]|nr:hypothetical protein NL108_011560 [Boleophthalmus pectinirostris]
MIPGSVVGGFMPLVGSPKANRFWGTGQTKNSSEAPYDDVHSEVSDVAWFGITGAPPWSQAWGGCSPASACWPGLPLRSLAGLSLKERRGAVLTWAHHPREDP